MNSEATRDWIRPTAAGGCVWCSIPNSRWPLRRLLPLLCTGLILGGTTAAQETTDTDPDRVILEPVVTIATREARPLQEVAGNVTVITRDELDSSLSTTLADAFRYTPGIDTTGSGTRFGSDGLVIRGVAGNRVAMLIDGIPLSDQFAIGNFSNAPRDLLDMQLTERIEVLHGPSSALYGSAALGGVVNFLTPDPIDLQSPQSGKGLRLAQGYQSADDSRTTTAGAAAGGDRLSGLGMVSVRRGHEADAAAAGDLDHQDVEQESGLAKLVYQDKAGNQLRGMFYGFRDDTDTNIRSLPGNGRFCIDHPPAWRRSRRFRSLCRPLRTCRQSVAGRRRHPCLSRLNRCAAEDHRRARGRQQTGANRSAL